jgi:hypothetical protein
VQLLHIKADLLVKYGGVAPKMAEEAHSQVIDQVHHSYPVINISQLDHILYRSGQTVYIISILLSHNDPFVRTSKLSMR